MPVGVAAVTGGTDSNRSLFQEADTVTVGAAPSRHDALMLLRNTSLWQAYWQHEGVEVKRFLEPNNCGVVIIGSGIVSRMFVDFSHITALHIRM